LLLGGGEGMARRRRSGISALRGALYGLARLLGDVQAASSGDPARIARRVARRAAGRAVGRLFRRWFG